MSFAVLLDPKKFVPIITLNLLLSFSVVVYVTDFHIAREGMLHAYDENMTKGDYVFIIFELDQLQVGIKTDLPFKWFFSSHKSTLHRYDDVKQAFEAAFVLAVKSPSSKSYVNFTEELKIRSTDEPFNSTTYTGYLFQRKTGKFLANKTKVGSGPLKHYGQVVCVVGDNYTRLSFNW